MCSTLPAPISTALLRAPVLHASYTPKHFQATHASGFGKGTKMGTARRKDAQICDESWWPLACFSPGSRWKTRVGHITGNATFTALCVRAHNGVLPIDFDHVAALHTFFRMRSSSAGLSQFRPKGLSIKRILSYISRRM